MKTQEYGIEIELTGITREVAAKTVATYFGTTAEFDSVRIIGVNS
jgi:hypothetical protein